MRFYSWKMLLSSLTATGIKRVYPPFESHWCKLVELFDTCLIFLKMIRSSKFPLWMAKPLFSMTIWNSPKTATRCNVISTWGKLKINLSTFCRMITWSPAKPTSAIPDWTGWMRQMGQIYPDWLLPWHFWKAGQAPQILQNQAFT